MIDLSFKFHIITGRVKRIIELVYININHHLTININNLLLLVIIARLDYPKSIGY